MQKNAISELIRGSDVLVVAQWEAKQGEADKVADILRRFLPQAQGEPGVKLFLIGRGKENPAQFLFYEPLLMMRRLRLTRQAVISRR